MAGRESTPGDPAALSHSYCSTVHDLPESQSRIIQRNMKWLRSYGFHARRKFLEFKSRRLRLRCEAEVASLLPSLIPSQILPLETSLQSLSSSLSFSSSRRHAARQLLKSLGFGFLFVWSLRFGWFLLGCFGSGFLFLDRCFVFCITSFFLRF